MQKKSDVQAVDNWRKWIAGLLLSPPVGFLALFFWNVNGKMAAQEEQLKAHDADISSIGAKLKEQDKKINDIHWYLIERNNVQVPSKRQGE
jgi:hypothetical protein